MRAEERLLKNFVGFLDAQPSDGPIRAAAAVEWACSTARCGAGGRARRLSIVRTFLVYLHLRVPGTEVPGPRLLPRAPRGTPCLYSDAEIGTLLAATRKLGPPGSLRPATVTTLIGLLASTGLRAGEALRLAIGDVKLDDAQPHLARRQFTPDALDAEERAAEVEEARGNWAQAARMYRIVAQKHLEADPEFGDEPAEHYLALAKTLERKAAASGDGAPAATAD